MSGAASFKGAIQMGPFVNVPVIAKSAVREIAFGLNLHCSEHRCRVKQGDMVCIDGGEALSKDQMVKGYGGVAGVDEAFIESLKAEKSPIIALDGFVPAADVDPRYWQKSYTVAADKGGAKAYSLVLALMAESGRVGLGHVVMGTKQYLCIIRPRDGSIALELLYWSDELLPDTAAKASVEGVTVTDQELALGR